MGLTFKNRFDIYKEIRYSPSLKKIEIYSHDRPMFYCFPRNPLNSIDLNIYDNAKSMGVKFFFESTINNPDIIATGAKERKFAGYGYHFYDVDCDDSIHVFLDNNFAPAGYVFIIPYNRNELTIGSTCFDSAESFASIKRRIDKFLIVNRIAKDMTRNSRRSDALSAYAYYDYPISAKAGEALLTGEAAGFMDASRGFGLIYAIESGYLAARAIIDGTNYDDMWKSSFGIDLKKYYHKRQIFQLLENSHYEKLVSDLIDVYGQRISVENYAKIKEN
jgi:flavin-dependent dehydrogenase